MRQVQNAAARLILRAPRHQHCTPLLQQFHWLPISERINDRTACMCSNSITGSAASYLSQRLYLYRPSCSRRSPSDTRILKLRRFNCSLSYFGPHIWNNLPKDVRHSTTRPSFKNKLKAFLFSEHFNWVIQSFAPTVFIVFVCTLVCVCVCVCVYIVVYACTTSFSCVYAHIFFSFLLSLRQSLSRCTCMYSICIVQRFEPQGRRFINFLLFYLYTPPPPPV